MYFSIETPGLGRVGEGGIATLPFEEAQRLINEAMVSVGTVSNRPGHTVFFYYGCHPGPDRVLWMGVCPFEKFSQQQLRGHLADISRRCGPQAHRAPFTRSLI